MTHPFWLITTRVVLDKQKKSSAHHILEIYKTSGLSGFYKGVGISLILVVNPIINFMIYEQMRALFVTDDYSDPGAIAIFLCSILAKTIACISTYPLLTIRTVVFQEKNKDWEEKQLKSVSKWVISFLFTFI